MYSSRITVPLPKSGDKGTIHVVKAGYVYLAVSYKWDKKNRKPIEKRYTIGKLSPDDPNLIIPNDNYEKYYGSIDKRAYELKLFLSSKERKDAGKFDSRLSAGTFFAIKEAMCLSGCYAALERTYTSTEVDYIVALTVHAISAQNSCAQDFVCWSFDNYCGLNRLISDSEISRLYKSLGSDEGARKVFFNLFREEYRKLVPTKKSRIIAFDSTNQNTYSKNLDYASSGKAKIDLKLPIINTAMFVDEETGIPLWYEHYEGAVLDKTQTPFSLRKVIDLGFKKLFAIFDRGYYSEPMIKSMRELEGVQFGVLCPENVNWVDSLIDEHGPEIKDREDYYVSDERVYASRYETELFGKNGYAYLFYDAPRAAQEHITIHETVQYFWNKAMERKRYSEKMEETFLRRGIIVRKLDKTGKDGKNFELYEDTETIQQLLDRAGYFVMISDEKLTPNEAIRLVRNRDKVEKSFETIKRHFDLSVTYTHSMETYSGKMFVAFIAAITHAVLINRLAPILSQRSSLTLAQLMSELNKYKIELRTDGSWMPAYALSKYQKQILAKLNLSEEKLFNFSRELDLLV
jgi:hypothetical protein